MEIVKIEFVPVKLKLRVPTIVAYGGGDEVENIVVKVTATDGKTGWGNCAPDASVTGEDLRQLKALAESDEVLHLLRGRDIYLTLELENLLLTQLADFPSLRAGISIALWDLLAKAIGIPLVRLLGQARSCTPTSITIPLLPLSQIKELAQYYKDQGFLIPKIKLGGKIDEDLSRIRLVQSAFGGFSKETPLRLDANQSYSVESALQLLEQLQEQNIKVEFLEQPTPAKHFYSLKQIADLTPGILIMADESALNCKDILYLSDLNAAHYINIKLMKCGGIESARQANYVAHCADIPTMMGCMDESVISISAALAVCLSHHNFHFADLDGHFEIEQDIATGGIIVKDGILYPVLDSPGLGITPGI